MPPKKAAAKRKADAPDASVRKSKRGSPSVGYGDEDEGALLVAKMQADRVYWETLSTPVLAAWLTDFPDHPQFDAGDRATIIQQLVTNDAARPTSVAKMQAVWRKWNKGAGPCPPHLAVDDPIPGSDAESEQEEEKEQSGSPPAQGPDATKNPAVVALLQQLEADRRDLQKEIASVRARQAPTPFSYSLHAQDSLRASGDPQGSSRPPQECLTCARPRLPAPLGASLHWVCTCALRGDLPADDPANVYLATLAAATRASAASSASAASATSVSVHHGPRLVHSAPAECRQGPRGHGGVHAE
jgi:hypothetical protein